MVGRMAAEDCQPVDLHTATAEMLLDLVETHPLCSDCAQLLLPELFR